MGLGVFGFFGRLFFGENRALKAIIAEKDADIERLSKERLGLLSRLLSLDGEIEKFKELLRRKKEEAGQMEEFEKHYHEKYPTQLIIYQGRAIPNPQGNFQDKIKIDIRDFFNPYDAMVKEVAEKLTGKNHNETAYNCLMWIQKNVKYVPDKENFNLPEFWMFSFETLEAKTGDCEDGAILLANLMLSAGVPYWRIRLCAGNVNGGGHAYVVYCRETDNKFCVLDWCYWPNKLKISDRKTHAEERNYSDKDKNFYVWFSWNVKYSYGKAQAITETGRDFKRLRA